ncbi:MAG: SemiSWEET transporter [Henriciella sp.]|uniref:SemiSWEET transporter n=1 Tax=Henriciella sp. TaxID=1968823 RepID=UPI003C77CAEF
MTDTIGLIAAFLTTASFLPQALMVLRTRNTESLSLTMYSMFTAGVACWLVYGIVIGSMPMIIANVITLGLAAIILAMKVMNTLQARRARAASETAIEPRLAALSHS